MTTPDPNSTAPAAVQGVEGDAAIVAETPSVAESAMVGLTQRGIVSKLGLLVGSHFFVDVYSAFVAPILLLLEGRCDLTKRESAWVLGFGSLVSGICQPVFAWLTDRFDSRMFAAIGLILAAVGMCSIGRADSLATLLLIFGVGAFGVGIYHPVGAASMGELAQRLPGQRRSLGVSIFFVAGMGGGMLGAFLVTRITKLDNGFDILPWLMIPGIIVALILHLGIRRVPHRHQEHRSIEFPREQIALRWKSVAVLYAASCLRFTVNMALFYLYLQWAEKMMGAANPGLGEDAVRKAATPIAGGLIALTVLGMAVGGLLAAALVRSGREKRPLIWAPILLSPVIVVFPFASVPVAYILAVPAGVAYAAMIPVSISLAQRLLPHRTSLASGLMLGAAWAVAATGPLLAEKCIEVMGLNRAFFVTAGLLVLAGLVCIGLSDRIVRESAVQPQS